MSTPNYISEKYVTTDDALLHLGFTPDQIKALPGTERTRYQNWVTEGNNKFEADTFPYTDNTPVLKGTKEYTFAKSAVLNWIVYKKRDKEGSKNASSARKDYEDDVQRVITLLSKSPTNKMYPIQKDNFTTDSTADIITPYSQTQGFPPSLLY